MRCDPLDHLRIQRLARGNHRHRLAGLLGKPQRQCRLAASCAAEQHDEAHEARLPRTGTTTRPDPGSPTTRTSAR